ncbi:MAG: Uma2 family endonuclease [Bacteroidia bacterium]|nr:Uma2 family endonuclease [Bacteroidia bacterium]
MVAGKKTALFWNEAIYPDSDGKPMADNTIQFEMIVKLHTGLTYLFREQKDVLVVSDLLWYPEEGKPTICTAPDVMVILGRPAGDRRSYRQWEEGGIAPQVVIEVLSASNQTLEMLRKIKFYETYGVSAFYIIDPYTPEINAWMRDGAILAPLDIAKTCDIPLLGIRLQVEPSGIEVYDQAGNQFLSPAEIKVREVEQRRIAEQERLAKEAALIEIERLRALLRNT